jgi:hypothetical protein
VLKLQVNWMLKQRSNRELKLLQAYKPLATAGY